jgi:hypothetical protein
MTIILTDPTNHSGDVSDELFPTTIFRSTANQLPQNLSPGTIILLRGLRVSFLQPPKPFLLLILTPSR